ncbi:hypothetical protein B0T26DRAFT_679397 [Lasiosphaeria miniovina]|uniref:Uncharacterized protein n=1 Tax=Lasiosphaeria miniovina TaxID=1954250 RepID=A0AA40A6E1_9PEZI|nr:uncharacterized protein B0T26DRAFT_679397 [Lasiosphaeria miniovina]KAK0710070.1 hypothetical protein B0T26DRAFT_679397 [Lasiosphaeria miniovina]
MPPAPRDLIFKPASSNLSYSDLIAYNPSSQVSHLNYVDESGNVQTDYSSLVIHVAAASRGVRLKQAAWGVYFGPDSQHNGGDRLDPNVTQSHQGALVEGLSRASDWVAWHIIGGAPKDHFAQLRKIYIATNSDYLIKFATTQTSTKSRYAADRDVINSNLNYT